MWVRNRMSVQDRSWIADRHCIESPSLGKLKDSSHHLVWRHRWPGWEFPYVMLTGGENLDVRAADIDCEYLQFGPILIV